MAVFLLLTLGSGIGAAAEVYVQPGDSIQTALDNAVSGDVIILKPGIYTENIIVAKDDLTIQSESGNPDDTIITAKSSDNHGRCSYRDCSVLCIHRSSDDFKGLEKAGYAPFYLDVQEINFHRYLDGRIHDMLLPDTTLITFWCIDSRLHP